MQFLPEIELCPLVKDGSRIKFPIVDCADASGRDKDKVHAVATRMRSKFDKFIVPSFLLVISGLRVSSSRKYSGIHGLLNFGGA